MTTFSIKAARKESAIDLVNTSSYWSLAVQREVNLAAETIELLY